MYNQDYILTTESPPAEESIEYLLSIEPPAASLDYLLSILPPAVESSWTTRDNWLFLRALVNVPEGVTERWQRVAAGVPGKTAEDVRARYEALEQEVNEIESGLVELPSYQDDDDVDKESAVSWDPESITSQISFGTCNTEKPKRERKKGTPWTKAEHIRFLEGLKRHGRGDWRSISREFVITKTPIQVASHAQKYFIRQASQSQEKKKRSSIHDVTAADTPVAVVVQQPPLPLPAPPPQPISFHGSQGGTGMMPPQMGYEYQPNFGHPFQRLVSR